MDIEIHISFKVGRVKYGCLRGFGICDVSIDIDINLMRGRLLLDTDKNIGQLHFLSMPTTYGEEVFVIDRDIKLPRRMSERLGYDSVILMRGEYYYNTFTSQFGVVEGIQVYLQKGEVGHVRAVE